MKNINDYSDFFIAVYTHSCKEYCDSQFFHSLLFSDIRNATVEIVDNSVDKSYSDRLSDLTNKKIHRVEIDRSDAKTQFLRNVTESVNYLRELFLKSNCKYFIIIESDVIAPAAWLSMFLEVIDSADIISGIYYEGFHSEELFKTPGILQPTPHVLSGCTLYKREIIEKFPFRWSYENIGAFPDAWMSLDARNAGYRLANYSSIHCLHLSKPNGSRGLEDIN